MVRVLGIERFLAPLSMLQDKNGSMIFDVDRMSHFIERRIPVPVDVCARYEKIDFLSMQIFADRQVLHPLKSFNQ